MASKAFLPLIGLLMVDAIIEVGFIGSMVGYLHRNHDDVPWHIITGTITTGQTTTDAGFQLFPKPAHGHIILNQGHTSNGAAGTAFVLGGIGLWLAWRQRRRERMVGGYRTLLKTTDRDQNTAHRPSRLFLAWTIFAILSFLLTLSALIYTFVVTRQTDNQTISIQVATENSGRPYPDLQWTPENWFKQVLTLTFADASQKSDIRTHLHLMEGWRWNLIPLLILGFAVANIAAGKALQERRGQTGHARESGPYMSKESPTSP